MDAAVLRDFFLGQVPAPVLDRDLDDAFVPRSRDSRELRMRDLKEAFSVTSQHLVRLLDAVIAGEVAPGALQAVGFGMIASDHFEWDGDTPDGERVANALYDWSAPEVNYVLSRETAVKFRHRLLTGENLFTRADAYSRS